MKKKISFILLIILIIIIVTYNNCYEHFSVKVQDAMIFKDYQDKLVGTYPDINIYPDLFIKSNGEYVNMIGTVHGVSEIKIPKPKDGNKGPEGNQGLQGRRGPEGPKGKDGEELVEEDRINNRNSTCIAPGGISISYMCKGPDGDSPYAPDGMHGTMCSHPGGIWTEENGRQVYRGGKCPKGIKGVPGKTCNEKYGKDECPHQPHKHGLEGYNCETVNKNLGITVLPDTNGVMRKCPQGPQGYPGKTCVEVNSGGITVLPDANGVMRKCPVQPNGNNGLSCYDVLNTLPECSESTPGVNSVDCVNQDTPTVKTCGVINPDKPSDVANNLSINGYNGNTLTINNNNAISFIGDSIKLPIDGKIVLKDANNNIIKTIDKSYIDYMILKSKQCKKCPYQNGKKWWNDSTNCQHEQGDCIECKECESGEYVEQACSQHSNTQCKQCQPGYVGIGCLTKCDPIKGEIPRDDKTACKTIGSNNYIDPNDDTKEKSIPDGYYRNPNDATAIIECQAGYYCTNGIKTKCTENCGNGKYRSGLCTSTTNYSCHTCPNNHYCNGINKYQCTNNCGNGQYRSGTCTSTTNYSCNNCPSDYYCNGINKNQCSNCGPGKKKVGGCTGNQNTQCSPCTSHTSYNKSAHQQGINWDTSPSCPHNCKIQIWDNTLLGNNWDVYGTSDNGWWIRGSKGLGPDYWWGHWGGTDIHVSGNELYFWQYTRGTNKWKFNVINNTDSYKSGDNKQTYCNTCDNKRSLGGSCESYSNTAPYFDTYGTDRLWHGLPYPGPETRKP
jgi:hypothetical protein